MGTTRLREDSRELSGIYWARRGSWPREKEFGRQGRAWREGGRLREHVGVGQRAGEGVGGVRLDGAR